MNKAVGIVVVIVSALTSSSVAAERPSAARAAAQQIRARIYEIRESMGEATVRDRNIAEICFRVGLLYQTARHELERDFAVQRDPAAPTNELVTSLVKDARSLPSFCGDKEKVKADPGYEEVPGANVAALQNELENMEARAERLASLP